MLINNTLGRRELHSISPQRQKYQPADDDAKFNTSSFLPDYTTFLISSTFWARYIFLHTLYHTYCPDDIIKTSRQNRCLTTPARHAYKIHLEVITNLFKAMLSTLSLFPCRRKRDTPPSAVLRYLIRRHDIKKQYLTKGIPRLFY